jgi:hypothetical protein
VSGYPGIVLLTGASLHYYLIARPDIKHKQILWKENSFVSPGDIIPGIHKISVRGIQTAPSEKIALTQVFAKTTQM